jgi:hypothetical protein
MDGMPAKSHLEGQRFGRLLVIQRSAINAEWICQCKCGIIKSIPTHNLLGGTTQSCGCLQRERASAANKTHGKSRTPEYNTWSLVIGRCENPHNACFSYYGGRGIKMCRRWRHSFETFLADMGPRPSSVHTLDRINNDGDYEPQNCRWATRTQQSRNQRNNHLIEFKGRLAPVAELAAEQGLSPDLVYDRLKAKWSAHKALTTPPRPLHRRA